MHTHTHTYRLRVWEKGERDLAIYLKGMSSNWSFVSCTYFLIPSLQKGLWKLNNMSIASKSCDITQRKNNVPQQSNKQLFLLSHRQKYPNSLLEPGSGFSSVSCFNLRVHMKRLPLNNKQNPFYQSFGSCLKIPPQSLVLLSPVVNAELHFNIMVMQPPKFFT